jgi:hypothetical protein
MPAPGRLAVGGGSTVFREYMVDAPAPASGCSRHPDRQARGLFLQYWRAGMKLWILRGGNAGKKTGAMNGKAFACTVWEEIR